MPEERPIRKALLVTMVVILLGLFAIVWATRTRRVEDKRTPVFNDSSLTETQNPAAAASQAQRGPPPSTSVGDQPRVVAEGMNVPVNFWARVVDQSDSPVPGVKLSIAVRHWGAAGPIVGASHRRYQRETAADGMFDVLNSSGDVLTIESLEKPGYSVPRGVLRSYGFNISTNVSVDRQHPQVIRIWRKIGDQPLLKGNIFSRGIVPDGRTYSVDLLKKVATEGTNASADLRVHLKRPAGVTRADKFDWSFSIEAVDGGIMECNEDTPMVAPLSGYAPSYTFQGSHDEERFSSFRKAKLFVKTRGGQVFAIVAAEIYSIYASSKTGAAVEIDYTANTNSSPVLQN